jgi:prepilin-type N-terminal cleavage/methylation domain-containing protein
MKKQNRAQRGFSLLEMMIVVAILTVVMAGIFSMMNAAQKRYAVEDTKLDLQQESREFLDQVIRDLHQAGYPNARMYDTAQASGANSNKVAVGLVRISHTDIVFEGDVDNDGTVNVVRYQLEATGGKCPCTLKRSQVEKVDGSAPDDQPTAFSAEVQRVLNSYGAGNSPLSINGSTMGVANDTLYAAYRNAPLFEFYDQNGVIVSGIPNDLSTSGTGNNTLMLASVRSVRVTINSFASSLDQQNRNFPALSMTSSARIANNRR